jgi:hypothetical protein
VQEIYGERNWVDEDAVKLGKSLGDDLIKIAGPDFFDWSSVAH